MPTKPTLLYLLILLSLSPLMSQTVAQQKAPDFTLTDIDGRSFTLSECSATVVLVDVFATWCSPCRESIPTFRALYSEYPRNQLEIVSISSEDMGTLESFARNPQTRMTWIVVRDPTGNVSLSYLGGDNRIPHLYLVDADSYIAYDHLGWREEDAPVLRSRINALLLGDNTDTDPPPNQSGLPLTTTLIIVGVIICLFVGSILAAGYLLDWSSSSKERSKKRKKRKRTRISTELGKYNTSMYELL